ncbi:uncharacterized protein N7506_012329 [Penicillium brevicompactum]|uniref:uncharacterized protein n=1 Tax=Penicillium brevicompactum TaxID=5074 RepID=UPI0025416371|nr:uncharacterized protein N7506_012329 [Penicillium brevicompactum]KAJ5319625.1 hypothetical protein N7506_012329 [Penicillium brevicompactum]
MLNRPPQVLLTTLATLQAHHLTEDSRVLEFILGVRAKMTPRIAANFARPTKEDLLYQTECGSSLCQRTCLGGSGRSDSKHSNIHRFNVPLDLNAVPLISNFCLQPEDSPSRKVAVLHGLGGMGKTQLAVRFARDHQNDFTAIFWLSGKDRESLVQSLSVVLSQLPGQTSSNEASIDTDVEQ